MHKRKLLNKVILVRLLYLHVYINMGDNGNNWLSLSIILVRIRVNK